MTDGQVWFVSSQNEVWGPYPWDSLREFASSGRVKRHSLVCNDRKSWISAEKVPGLFDGIAPDRPPRRVGLLAKRLLLGALVLASLGLLGWGGWWLWGQVAAGIDVPSTSPDLATPEGAAKTLMEFQARRDLALSAWQAAHVGVEERIAAEMKPILVDSSDLDKKVEKQKKRADAWRAHEKELADFRVEVVDTKDVQGLKQVKVRLTGKKLAQEAEEWKVVDRKDEKTFVLTQIEGRWKVK